MKFEGIVFLIAAWGIIIGLAIYCFRKVLKSKPQDR